MGALMPLLGALLPPLLHAIADALDAYHQKQADHAATVAALTQALADGQARLAALTTNMAASDAAFQKEIHGV